MTDARALFVDSLAGETSGSHPITQVRASMPREFSPQLAAQRLRGLVSLSGGLGFGSEEIRARSLAVARKAHDGTAERWRAAVETPITNARTARGDEAVGDALAIRPEGDAPESARTAHRTKTVARAAAEKGTPPSALAKVEPRTERAGAVPDRAKANPAGMATIATPINSKSVHVTRLQCIGALVLDGIVALSVVLLAGVVNYAAGAQMLGRTLVDFAKSHPTGLSSHPLVAQLLGVQASWTVFALQLALTALPALFLCQVVSTLAFHATLGRFVVGIELARKQRSGVSAVTMAIAETLSLGGIFSLPFVLVTPKKMPIFSWLGLERGA